MTEADIQGIIKEIKGIHEKLTEFSENAQLDSFLGYFDNSPHFLQFGSDGKMRHYEEFRNVCTEYYNTLKEQKISTIIEIFNILDKNLVILSWTGNIIAHFKNGDTMKMENYSVSSVFRIIDGKWKIIHSHESALPPEII